MGKESKNHWEKVYSTKGPMEVSWTQEVPATSLHFIHSFPVSKTAKIIDIGGGDSHLVDYLLNEGYENITVLDISGTALDKAKQRLGDRAEQVTWVESDVLQFTTSTTFDVWHDRATFHFLTTPEEVSTYLSKVRQSVTGYVTIGTFSKAGPDKCSGLPIRKYSEEALSHELHNGFQKIRCITEDHLTPFKTIQEFLFCSFRSTAN